MSIDIKGIDKVTLLKALWLNAKPAAFFNNELAPDAPKWDEKFAAIAVTKHIDYFQGRCIKVDLSKDIITHQLYDREWGQGKFEQIVNLLKEAK